MLPSKHHGVELIIKDTHNRMLHSRVNTALMAIREQLWIIRGRQTVKKMRKMQKGRRKTASSHCRNNPPYPKNAFRKTHLLRTLVLTLLDSYTPQRRVQMRKMLRRTYVCLRVPRLGKSCSSRVNDRTEFWGFHTGFLLIYEKEGTTSYITVRTFKSASKDIVKISRAKEVTQQENQSPRKGGGTALNFCSRTKGKGHRRTISNRITKMPGKKSSRILQLLHTVWSPIHKWCKLAYTK